MLREQHPDLAEFPLREVAGGWGNQMWRLGDELAVRVQRMDPRRPVRACRGDAIEVAVELRESDDGLQARLEAEKAARSQS